jgi:hypothetical protein
MLPRREPLRPIFARMIDATKMVQLCDEIHRVMVKAFRQIENAVPPPKFVEVHGGMAFRCVERTAEQAMVQKLARVISGLGSVRVLLAHGYTQEIATLQRTLDEFGQDIIFLSLPLLGDEKTELHDRFLKAFFDEEFDQHGDPLSSSQRREMIPRRKIRAAIARSKHGPIDPSTHTEIQRTIDKAYSGYVHGASPQILDMYGGAPPHFHIEGMRGTPRIETAARDLWNYFHRGLNAMMCVALVLRMHVLADDLMKCRQHFEEQSGWEPVAGLGAKK